MGNELSTEQLHAREQAREAHKARRAQETAEELDRKVAEQWPAFKARYTKKKPSRPQQQEPRQKQDLRSADREDGEISSQELPADPARVAISSTPADAETPQPGYEDVDVLAAWNPRKERRASSPAIRISATNDNGTEGFFGFGLIEPSQDQNGGNHAPNKPAASTSVTADALRNRVSVSANVKQPMKSATGNSSVPAKRHLSQLQGDETATDRRLSVTSRPKIQKTSAMASPQSSARDIQQIPGAVTERPPKWYKTMKPPKTREKNQSDADIALSGLSTRIRKAQDALKKGNKDLQKSALAALRESLHTVIFCEVTGPLLRLHMMLSNGHGLSVIFDKQYSAGFKWPFDISADAEELYNKWSKRDFETDILRGILTSTKSKSKDGITSKAEASIKPGWKLDAKFHGNGDLLNGAWWPYVKPMGAGVIECLKRLLTLLPITLGINCAPSVMVPMG
jgi:hypothetical protein